MSLPYNTICTLTQLTYKFILFVNDELIFKARESIPSHGGLLFYSIMTLNNRNYALVLGEAIFPTFLLNMKERYQV